MSGYPLDGIRVLDFTQALAGPLATTLLADLGADVVKIEPPDGASQRNLGVGELRPNVLRNKRSIVVDLKNDDADDVVRPLLEWSDVLVQNYSPGTMAQLGYDYESVREHNEEIVYASLSGFGESGPYGDRLGFDSLTAAMSGLFWNTGEPDRKPSKIGGNTIDAGTGMLTAFAIMVGIWEKERYGTGQKIETSLFETAALTVMDQYTRYSRTGETPTRQGHTLETPQPLGMFQTAEDPLWLTCPYQAHWERLCAALDREEWATDERFATMEDRVDNREALHALLDETFTDYERATLIDLLHEAGVPSGEVQTLAEAAEDEHLHERGTLQSVEDVDETPVTAASTPIQFSETAVRDVETPPAAGSDTADVLRECGFEEADVDLYVDDGVVAVSDRVTGE